MTVIADIADHGAVVAWSPIAENADILAVGSKDSGGIGFDEYGGELELYELSMGTADGGTAFNLIGKIQLVARFSTIGWTQMKTDTDNFPMGVIAGGMVDGSLHLWDPSLISGDEGGEPLLSSIPKHTQGLISALAFNPHDNAELAIGGSDGTVSIVSLANDVQQPESFMFEGSGAEVTQVAWNSQVSHILAASTTVGAVIVYDTKQRKPWCELRCGNSVSDLAWNPTEGLHLLTASADDRDPVLKLWDLKSSTSIPLTTLQGHNQGILSIGWCPHDSGLLLSCGKDNKTLLWDLYTMKPIYELPSNTTFEHDVAKTTASSNMFGGRLSSSQQKRYDVKWSPVRRGVVSTCSFDRKVQAHSMIGAATTSGRTPKWMQQPCGVTCGFGGSIISFRSRDKVVRIDVVAEAPELKEASENFEQSVATGNFVEFCASKSDQCKQREDGYEATMWGLMKIIFEDNAREQILQFFGFDANKINDLAMNFQSAKDQGSASQNLTVESDARDVIQKALVVGNFEAAVECCLKSGNLADALILSSCGGAELWEKTQAKYFELQSESKPYLSIVNAVIHEELDKFVESSDPLKWEETLAILSTYAKSEEFPDLCLSLGARLESFNDNHNASLCFICALSLEHAAKYWKTQLDEIVEERGSFDLLDLHMYVEKVTTFLNAVGLQTPLGSDITEKFGEYAECLASQGLLKTSAYYCRSESGECAELRDRLYRSKETSDVQSIFVYPPSFPFTPVNVGIAVAKKKVEFNSTNEASHGNEHATIAAIEQQVNGIGISNQHLDALPQGWIEIQDPASGNMYYANSNTGETTWERPRLHASTTNRVLSPNQNFEQNLEQKSVAPDQNPAEVVSKYGDGFVTSASHPDLGKQYGNTVTSNPYVGSERPGTAAITPTSKSFVTEAFDPNNPPPVDPDLQPIVDSLLSIVNFIPSRINTTNEKKQFAEIQKGVGIFIISLSKKQISTSVQTQMGNFVAAIHNKDFATAINIQTRLVNSDWRHHKDWLKGMKFLSQLASRKM